MVLNIVMSICVMQPVFPVQVHREEMAKQKLFNYLWNAAVSGCPGRTSSNASGSAGQRMISTVRKQMGRFSVPPVTNTQGRDCDTQLLTGQEKGTNTAQQNRLLRIYRGQCLHSLQLCSSVLLHSQKGWFHLFQIPRNADKLGVDSWSVNQPTDWLTCCLVPSRLGGQVFKQLDCPDTPSWACTGSTWGWVTVSASWTPTCPSAASLRCVSGSRSHPTLPHFPLPVLNYEVGTKEWLQPLLEKQEMWERRRKMRLIFQRAEKVTSLEKEIIRMGSHSPNLALAKVGPHCCK